jgi:hypothetical protein
MADLAAALPELAELRRAASSPSISRFSVAVTGIMSRARVVFAAALLAARRRAFDNLPAAQDTRLAAAVLHGALVHAAILDVMAFGMDVFKEWYLTAQQRAHLISQLRQLASPGSDFLSCVPSDSLENMGPEVRFPHTVGLFLSALAGGWPWELAIKAFAHLDRGRFSCCGRTFRVGPHTSSLTWIKGDIRLSGSGTAAIHVYLDGNYVALICSPRPLVHSMPSDRPECAHLSQPGVRVPSPTLPKFLQLPRDKASGGPTPPTTRVTTIVERRAKWHGILGPLDGATAAIVDGLLAYPRDSWDWLPLRMDNHPSWERDEAAKEALGPTIAAWIHSGILEWVPPHCRPPLIVEPLGAVEKGTAPFYRLISDARRSNKNLGKWPVRCMNIKEMVSALDYGAIMSGDDVNDAYHLSPLAGCTGGLKTDLALACGPDGRWEEYSRLHVGCSPRTCLGTCDKARSGCSINGHLFRFAAAHFGQKLAGSPLNCLFLAIIRHLLRRFGHMGPKELFMFFLWVDDLIMARNIKFHGWCGGLASGCTICAKELETFEQARSYWHWLAEELGISLSTSKRQDPGQRVEYTGVIVDTIEGRLYIPEKKLEKLRKCLQDLASAEECSTRTILSVQGRVRHYSICIKHIEPLVPSLRVAGEDLEHLDRKLAVTEELRTTSSMILSLVHRFAPAGASIWPFVPSSLYGAFLRGETAGAHVFTLVWDASHLGLGGTVRSHDDRLSGGTVIVATHDSLDTYEAQVHREAVGGPLILEAASKVVDLHGAVVILRNDSTAALTALRKGSSRSVTLQSIATRMNQLCADLDATPLYLHAPGKALIEEGVDDASRRLASAIAGPACSEALRRQVHELASLVGWEITLDAFASASNRLVPRYFSEFAEPLSEAVDALAVTDWHSSSCPHCGGIHRETLFAFPPPALIRRFVAKARADGARAVVIVPFAITASYWPRLTSAAVPAGGRPFIHIRNPSEMLREAVGFSSSALAVFAVDFGPSSSRGPDNTVPGCGQERDWRGRPRLGHPVDCEDRRRIRDALALRLRFVNVGRPPSPLPAL